MPKDSHRKPSTTEKESGVMFHISGAGVISVNSSELVKSEKAKKQIEALERIKQKKLLKSA